MSGQWQGSNRRARLPKTWPAIRRRILNRDHHTCRRCGNPATEVDHIHPGDNHHDSNLQALCRACHATKTAAEANAAHQPRPPRHRPKPKHPGLR